RHGWPVVVLLVHRTRQAKDARQVEDGVRLEPVFFGDALDGELPAAQNALGIGWFDRFGELPAGMQAAAGVDDRDRLDAELEGDLRDGSVDLLVAGGVLAVEVGVEDAHTGNVRRLGPLVRRAGLDRL